MSNVLVVVIIVAILVASIYKLYRDKKNNVKCSTCPYGQVNGICNNPEQKNQKNKIEE